MILTKIEPIFYGFVQLKDITFMLGKQKYLTKNVNYPSL